MRLGWSTKQRQSRRRRRNRPDRPSLQVEHGLEFNRVGKILFRQRYFRMTIDLRLDPAEVSLLTDLYELTVSAAFFDHGFNETASFEVSMRRMPPGRGFMVAAGIERLIEALEEYRFDASAIEHLESLHLFKPE